MADLDQPKKETVRITLPPGPGAEPAPSAARAHDTVRINLPARPPSNGASQSPAAAPPAPPTPLTSPAPPRPPVFVPPAPLSSSGAVASATGDSLPPNPPMPFKAPPPPNLSRPPILPPRPSPVIYPGSGSQVGPKKETARISLLPDPSPIPSPAVKMTKTQPLTTMPAASVPRVPVTVDTTSGSSPLDLIPRPLCWTLLGISALTLLIQIWNYFSA